MTNARPRHFRYPVMLLLLQMQLFLKKPQMGPRLVMKQLLLIALKEPIAVNGMMVVMRAPVAMGMLFLLRAL
jgi:hypothetical protein